MNTRQWNFYKLLKKYYETHGEIYWVSKQEIVRDINEQCDEKVYALNYSMRAHDLCSQLNADMKAINESPEIDKFVLLKDNYFKIATKQEAEEEIERLKKRAMNLLVRMSRLSSKVKNHGQGKLLSNRLDEIDEESQAREYIETFIERGKDDTKRSEN